MILKIDTTKGDNVLISLSDGKKTVAKKSFSAPRAQAEKLLSAIEKIIKSHGFDLKMIKRIEVAGEGVPPGSGEVTGFSALRIGVVTANALGYALGVPVGSKGKKGKRAGKIQIVVPRYDREPSITVKKPYRPHHI